MSSANLKKLKTKGSKLSGRDSLKGSFVSDMQVKKASTRAIRDSNKQTFPPAQVELAKMSPGRLSKNVMLNVSSMTEE